MNPAEQLQVSDADMARVLEDVLARLDRRGLLNMNDLPEPAQAKLERRTELRARMRMATRKTNND